MALSPQIRKALKKCFKNRNAHGARFNWVHHEINYRVELAAEMANATENGIVGIFHAGRGCDGGSFRWVEHRPVAGLFAENKARDEDYSWADGAMEIRFVKPSEYYKTGYFSNP